MNIQAMKAKILILFVIALITNSCNKNIYTTSPQLSFKTVNATSFSNGDLISFNIEVTDKEGDIQDSIWIQRVSRVCPGTGAFASIYKYSMPQFTATKDLKATIEIDFRYGQINTGYPPLQGCGNKNDTSYFRFWIKDNAGNVSDTIKSPDCAFLK